MDNKCDTRPPGKSGSNKPTWTKRQTRADPVLETISLWSRDRDGPTLRRSVSGHPLQAPGAPASPPRTEEGLVPSRPANVTGAALVARTSGSSTINKEEKRCRPFTVLWTRWGTRSHVQPSQMKESLSTIHVRKRETVWRTLYLPVRSIAKLVP